MINMIPAWPQLAERTQEDGTVNLVRLLSQSSHPTRLVVTDYTPMLRYFLAANHLLETPWVSVFDELQQVHQAVGLPLSVEDIELPDGVDLIYGPDTAYLYRQEQLVGTFEMAKPGFVKAIHWGGDDGQRVDTYDDRGFLSSTIELNNDNQRTKQTWWTQDGETALIFDGTQYHWLNAPAEVDQDFDTLEALQLQVITAIVAPDDHFIVRLVEDNHELSRLVSQNWTTTLQIATQNDLPAASDADLVEASRAVVLPTGQMLRRLQRRLPESDSTHWNVIAPYATTLSLGFSNEADYLTVYWHLNDLNKERTEAVYLKLLAAMARHIDYALTINVHNDEEVPPMLKTALYSITQYYGISGDSPEFAMIQHALFDERADTSMANIDESILNDTGDTEKADNFTAIKAFMERLKFRVHSDFSEIRSDFSDARVLMDLGSQPNLFMQIQAISVGIPQVNEVDTGYVQSGKNGDVIVSDAAAVTAVRTYLDQLPRWSQSLVVNTRLIDQHAENQLLVQWEEAL
ncbi:accessory Sec system protein Asp1 [Lacticaseibacillus brantae]|nr:accessory Sec system protein Asp1 [Lacticaseibacillus brantae]